MIIDKDEKLHIMYRAMYDGATRRHFIGKVLSAQGAICRLAGYVFIYDQKTTMFVRKIKERTTIIDIAESGYIVNVIHPDTDLGAVEYKYDNESGVICTDGENFSLNINEFTPRS